MTRFSLFAVAVIATPLAGGTASADDLSLAVTHSTIVESHIDNQNGDPNDDNYGILINRTNLNGNAGDLSAHLRLDTTTFYERPTPRGLPYKNDLRLERFAAEYQLGDWRLVGGDFYRQLGRGIILSLRKEDEVGIDVAIRGGEIRYRSDNHLASVFGGVVNPANLDSVTQKHVRDTEDVMVGGEYHYRGIEWLKLGAHALFTQPRVSVDDAQDLSQSVGVFCELTEITDWLSLYLEADGQYRLLAGLEQLGFAAYTTADAHFGDTSVMLEGIYLNGFEQLGSPNTSLGQRDGPRTVYNRPPTLQRLQEEVLNNTDAAGGRLKVEHYIESIDLVLKGNALWRFTGEKQEVMQVHGWGGGELTLFNGASHLAANAGYRYETKAGIRSKSMFHFYVDWVSSVGGGFAVHATTDTELRTLTEREYWRGSTYLGLEKSGTGSLTFELGYDTEKMSTEEKIRNHFFAGILGLEVSDAVKMNIVAGTQRGGLKCVFGLCRDYPPFAGARVEVVGRW